MTAGCYLAKTPQLPISIRGSKNFAALPAASADKQNKLFFIAASPNIAVLFWKIVVTILLYKICKNNNY